MFKSSKPVEIIDKNARKIDNYFTTCFKPFKATKEGDNDLFQKADTFRHKYSIKNLRIACIGYQYIYNNMHRKTIYITFEKYLMMFTPYMYMFLHILRTSIYWRTVK